MAALQALLAVAAIGRAQPTASEPAFQQVLFTAGNFSGSTIDCPPTSLPPTSTALDVTGLPFVSACQPGHRVEGTFTVNFPDKLPPATFVDDGDPNTTTDYRLDTPVSISASFEGNWNFARLGPGEIETQIAIGFEVVKGGGLNYLFKCEKTDVFNVGPGLTTAPFSAQFTCDVNAVNIVDAAAASQSGIPEGSYVLPVTFVADWDPTVDPSDSNPPESAGTLFTAAAVYGAPDYEVKPSVVFPADNGHAGWDLELSGVNANDITAVTFGDLPAATIRSKQADTIELTQVVPPGAKLGQYPVKVIEKGVERALGIFLYVSGIEIVDPADGLLVEMPGAPPTVHVTSNVSLITAALTAERIRKAVSADGVTEVILRIPSDKPLTLSLLNNGSADPGILRTLDGQQQGRTLDAGGGVPPVSDPSYGRAVFAVYRPPPDLPLKPNAGQYDLSTMREKFDDPDPADPGTFSINLSITRLSPDFKGDIDNRAALRKHRALTLLRPPLALIHGVWSGPGLWEESGFEVAIEKAAGPRDIERASYEDNNAASFDPRQKTVVGVEALKYAISSLTRRYRNFFKIAATQVDVIAHSMGGLMTRVFSQRPAEYLQKENYHKGWVHKLITLDTPHSGALIGVFLMNNKDNLVVAYPSIERDEFRDGDYKVSRTRLSPQRVTVQQLLSMGGMHADRGAVEGFQPCSPAYQAIEASPIPTHAVSGLRPDRFNELSLLGHLAGSEIFGLANIFKIISFAATEGRRSGVTIDDIFGGPENDTIVEAISMRAGFPFAPAGADSLSKPAHDQADVIHAALPGVSDHKDTITGNAVTFEQVGRILRTSLTEGETYGMLRAPRDYRAANTYSTPATGPCDPNPFGRRSPLKAKVPQRVAQELTPESPYIEITEPAIDAVFDAGQEVVVRAAGRNGLVPLETFFYGTPYSPESAGPGALEARLQLRPDAAGAQRIGVMARDATGATYTGLTSIFVRPAQPVTALLVSPEAIVLDNLATRAPIQVRGQFGGGASISLSKVPQLGFRSANSSIAAVDSRGIVTATGIGSTTIEVSYEALRAEVAVTVAATNVPPRFTPVAAFEVGAGDMRNVPVNAVSPTGNLVSLVAESLPAFATFAANAGAGELRISPREGDAGDYRVVITATDNGMPPMSARLNVNFTVPVGEASGPGGGGGGGGGAGGGPAPSIGAGGVVDAASYQGLVAPGGIGSVFGVNLAPGTEVGSTLPLPTTLLGVRVLVNGIPAPLIFVSTEQINFQMPFEIPAGGMAEVVVERDGVRSPPERVTMVAYAPAVFVNPNTGEPIVQRHPDFATITSANPARAADVLIVYVTGVGGLSNPPPTGAAARANPLALSLVAPTATLAGSPITAISAALTPNFVGLAQVAVQLPAQLAAAAAARQQNIGTLPLVIRFGENASQPVNLPVDLPNIPGPATDVGVRLNEVLPSTVVQQDRLTLRYTILNPSGVSGAAERSLYLSTDQNISSAQDALINTRSVEFNGGDQNFNSSGNDLPEGLAPGTYYVGLVVSFPGDSNASNDTSNALPLEVVTVRPPFDIDVAILSVEPTTVGAGDPIDIEYEATGRNQVSGTFSRAIYLSQDATITEQDTLVATRTFDILEGTADVLSAGNVLPRETPPGNYFVGVIVETAGDTNPADNVSDGLPISVVAERMPFDLGVGLFSVEPSSAAAGAPISVTYVVVNYSGSTGLYWRDLYISIDDEITIDDVLVNRRTVRLEGEDSVVVTSSNNLLPADLAPGSYFVGVILESEDDDDPDDNASNALPITIPAANRRGTLRLIQHAGELAPREPRCGRLETAH